MYIQIIKATGNGGMIMIEDIFMAFGTVNKITVYEKCNINILRYIRSKMLELDSMLTIFDKNSIVSTINESAGVKYIEVPYDVYRLLNDSKKYGKMTNGIFDVTKGKATAFWRESIKKHEISEYFADSDSVSWRCISLTQKADTYMVCLDSKNAALDFGGIAKGFAVEMAYSILKEKNIKNAVINFGGSVKIIGHSRITGIQNPFMKTGEIMGIIPLKDNESLVTSGIYEQWANINHNIIHHIIDPRTMSPSDKDLVSVTLKGHNAETLDVLATTVMILGLSEGTALLRKKNIDAIFVTRDGNVFSTFPFSLMNPVKLSIESSR